MQQTRRLIRPLPIIVMLMLVWVVTACVPVIRPPDEGAAGGNANQAETPAGQNARAALAQELQVDAAAITVVSEEAVEWPDACLGAPAAEEMCAQVVTPGYQITLAADGVEYQVHTNADGSLVRLAPAQEETGAAPDSGGISFIVESIAVNVSDADPVQVEAVVSGQLVDACTTIEGATVESQETTFVITLQTARPADQMCAQVLTPFEQIVALEMPAGAAGDYTVQAGDVEQSFTVGE